MYILHFYLVGQLSPSVGQVLGLCLDHSRCVAHYFFLHPPSFSPWGEIRVNCHFLPGLFSRHLMDMYFWNRFHPSTSMHMIFSLPSQNLFAILGSQLKNTIAFSLKKTTHFSRFSGRACAQHHNSSGPPGLSPSVGQVLGLCLDHYACFFFSYTLPSFPLGGR